MTRTRPTALDERDRAFLARCIELARQGLGRAAPNPLVGCVITTRGGEVLAEGYHRAPGTLHAEADALANLARAGGDARGCTAYVNLEPCNHRRNRRTSPCAPALAEAGISRLVIGMGDPIRSHAGGARWLAKRGVEVVRDVLRAECAELNRAFVTWARRHRPHIVLKAAVTLDGKVATRTGESQWITGKEARRHGHGLRHELQAILAGVGTVLADDPRLTARGIRGGCDPIRVVVDSRLRTPPAARVLPAHSASRARVIVATTARAAKARQRRLEQAGAEVWRVGDGARVDIPALVTRLGAEEIISLLVEGGPGIHGAFVDANLVDELALYIAPMAVGGASPSWLAGAGVDALADAARFRFVGEPMALGTDVLLRARRRR